MGNSENDENNENTPDIEGTGNRSGPVAQESPAGGPSAGDPIRTVEEFLTALEALDIDRALTHVSAEIVYQNVPLPPARGIAAFEKQMRVLTRYATGFEARMHHIAANDGVVLTERTDVLRAGDWEAAFWVCGTFEVRDGRIVLWRDYFDWATFITASLRGLSRTLAGAVSRRLGPTT